jgi:hypothetical protein
MYSVNADETYETFRQESGMRYQLQTTTSSGSPLTTPLHVVLLTEPHDSEPLVRYHPEPIDRRMLARS